MPLEQKEINPLPTIRAYPSDPRLPPNRVLEPFARLLPGASAAPSLVVAMAGKGGHAEWVDRTYERLIGISADERASYTSARTWQNTQSATEREARSRQTAASSSSQMPSQSPALEDNPELEDFIRIRRDLGMAPTGYQPTRYTHIVEGRPVQVLSCFVFLHTCGPMLCS